MSALRINHPDAPVQLVDLGPAAWVPLRGRATLRGHVVQGRAGQPSHHAPSRTADGQRAYRARRAVVPPSV